MRGVNVAGDVQADRTVHGGPEQALCAYAREDYTWWEAELGRTLERVCLVTVGLMADAYHHDHSLAGRILAASELPPHWREWAERRRKTQAGTSSADSGRR